MKYTQLFLIFAIAILTGTFSELSAQGYGGKRVTVNNTQTTLGVMPVDERSVFKQLIKLPDYGVFDHIAFEVDGDTVTLFGKVAIAKNRKDAERAVKRVRGVSSVTNNIEILPLSQFDDRLRIQILRTFARSGLFRYFQGVNPSVRIIVDSGHVELEGFVANRGDYNTMNILARGVGSSFSVKNNLIIEKEEAR